MKKYQVFIISFLVLFIFSGAVFASEADGIANGTVAADNMDDSVDILCSDNYSQVLQTNREFNGNTFSELQNEIDDCSNNDTIIFNNNISQDGSNSILITKSLTIDGNGYTIDAQQKSGIFSIASTANVTLKNIIFKNAKNETLNGAAIYSASENLNASNCTFINNRAYNGGAIYSSNCCLTKCVFINNSAMASGGAVCFENDSSLTYCDFEYNYADNGGAIYSKENCGLNFCTFTGNLANGNGGAVYWTNPQSSISGCDFENNSASEGGAIYWNGTEGILEFSKFVGNVANNAGGAVFLSSFNQNYISYTSFFNNTAEEGGALYIINSTVGFESSFLLNNTALNGGAISYNNSNTEIADCNFLYNVAHDAGAILLNNSQANIRESYFEFNVAFEKGGAIYWISLASNLKCNISGSQFYNNKAKSYALTAEVDQGSLTLELGGWNNYINAIYSTSLIELNDVTYWNGMITNTDVEYYNNGASGQNITLEIYDSQNNLLINTTLQSNTFGQQYYDLFDWDDGYYTYKAYHLENNYYTYVECSGNFTLNRPSSSITLNIPDFAEFRYNESIIHFNAINRTLVRAVITNENGSIVYYNNTVYEFSSRVIVNLASRDEFYKITVYNLPTGKYSGSQDSKLFRILKTNSSISINPIQDAIYGDTLNVIFNVENKTDINITVYNENKSIVYTSITNNTTISLPILPAGQYNITATNIGNENITCASNFTTFNVLKATNIVNVSTRDFVYGYIGVITILADADGNYTLDVNGSLSNVSVIDGQGKIELSLPCGSYYANATFKDPNYNTVITNVTFNVLKADNNVRVLADDVVYGSGVVVTILADADGNYTLDVNGSLSNVSVIDGQGKIELSLPCGSYYANATFENPNYNMVITNATFNVLKADNNVCVLADDVVYGSGVVVTILADVDGNYTLDVNGSLSNVSVIGGQGIIELSLPCGCYYANATFKDSNYNTVITNATFSVLKDCNLSIRYNEDIVSGDTISFFITVQENATGNITISFGNATYTGIITKGNVSIDIPNVEFGDYIVSVRYGGDEYYLAKESKINIHVKKVMVDAYDAIYGWAKSITYSVKLVDENGNAVSDREMFFYIDGKTFKSTTDGSGLASVSFSLNVGAYEIKISYLSENVTKKITVVSRFSGNKNLNMYYFDGTKYSFKVYGDNGKVVGANQKVVVKLNKKTYTLKTNKNGVVILKIPKTVKPGTFTITATYKGQTVKNTIKVKQILTSKKKVKVKRTAKKLILKAKLKKKLKGKKIIFKFKGKKYIAKTNKKSIAKVKIKKKVIKKLKKGKSYKVKINYFKTGITTKVKVK